jgi:hypothetical protein
MQSKKGGPVSTGVSGIETDGTTYLRRMVLVGRGIGEQKSSDVDGAVRIQVANVLVFRWRKCYRR